MDADHARFGEALTALDAGDVEELEALLHAHPDLVRARVTTVDPPYDGYFHGATLLHHVAGNPIRGELPDDIVQVTRLLLEAGANPDAGCGGGPTQPGTAGATTLGLVVTGAQAHIQGHTEALIDMLLSHGASLDREAGMFGTLYHTVEHSAPLDRLRPWGPFRVTPLHAAAWAGWIEVVVQLVERGADPTIREPTYDGRADDWAFHCGHQDVVAALKRAE